MKIGIDARMMGKGFGLARYVEQLVLELARIDKVHEYVLFVREHVQGVPKNFRLVPMVVKPLR